MLTIFEKLLPVRWWKKQIPIREEQFWSAFASTESPQTQAVLHVAQDKFISHIQGAANVAAAAEERLRSLDRAMAIVDFLTEVDGNFTVAKEEVKRRAAQAEAAKQQQ